MMTQQNGVPRPEDVPIPEDDPMPQREQGFGGTETQIRGAAVFYRIAAYTTGVMLLLLVAEMVLKYAFNLIAYAGGTMLRTGEANVFTLAEPGMVVDGFNVSIAVLIVHGWLYVVYLLATFILWSRMRWDLKQLILIALGGVIPFLSFVMEKKVHKQVVAELEKNPQQLRRY